MVEGGPLVNLLWRRVALSEASARLRIVNSALCFAQGFISYSVAEFGGTIMIRSLSGCLLV